MQKIDVPQWFQTHLEVPFERVSAEVRGCSIEFAIWGERSKPGLVLVHGGLAHFHWWRYLAPFFTDDYCLIAPDISGHGESGRREQYSGEGWAAEIVEAVNILDCERPPVVIGHSLGGLLSLLAATTHPRRFGGLIIVDAPIIQKKQSHAEGQRGKSYLHITPYPSLDIAKSRFRLLPDQSVGHPYIFDFLAETSLKQVPKGWIWKFDPAVFLHAKPRDWAVMLPQVEVPMAFIRGEQSAIVPDDIRSLLIERARGKLAMVDVPEAHHHIMLDQPQAFVASLRAILAAWSLKA